MEASNAFYGALFGWEADDQGEDMGHYTLMRKSGKTVAGNMAAMSEEQPSVWVTYISVDDADATVDLAKKAGATVFVEPMDVSDIGRMAVFADPDGRSDRRLAAEDLHRGRTGQRGRRLRVERAEHPGPPRGQSLLRGGVRVEPNDLDMGGMNYTEWKLGDRSVAGMMTMPDMVPAEVPAHWLVYFGVEDTDATVVQGDRARGNHARAAHRYPSGALCGPDGPRRCGVRRHQAAVVTTN